MWQADSSIELLHTLIAGIATLSINHSIHIVQLVMPGCCNAPHVLHSMQGECVRSNSAVTLTALAGALADIFFTYPPQAQQQQLQRTCQMLSQCLSRLKQCLQTLPPETVPPHPVLPMQTHQSRHSILPVTVQKHC